MSGSDLVSASRAGLAGLAGLLVLVATIGLSSAWSPAGAHTDLLQASPGPAQQAGGTIDFIDLVFVDSISDFELTLESPSGAIVEGAVTVPDGRIVRYAMPALAEAGRYVVRFTMISADGDFTESGYFFTYEPTAIEPVRLGAADVPSNTGTYISIAAGAVFTLCIVGLVLMGLARMERNRAATSATGADPDRNRRNPVD